MIHEATTLVILAGGEGKRMGFPKHRLSLGGLDVLTHLHNRLGPLFAGTIVVGRDLGAAVPTGAEVAEDCYAVRSPLVGIHAGLAATPTEVAFVVACDMPHVRPELAELLLGEAGGVDVAVPVIRGFYEPLCAVYRTSCLGPIERMIARGTLKVSELYGSVVVREVSEARVRAFDPSLRSFVNLNTVARVSTGGWGSTVE